MPLDELVEAIEIEPNELAVQDARVRVHTHLTWSQVEGVDTVEERDRNDVTCPRQALDFAGTSMVNVSQLVAVHERDERDPEHQKRTKRGDEDPTEHDSELAREAELGKSTRLRITAHADLPFSKYANSLYKQSNDMSIFNCASSFSVLKCITSGGFVQWQDGGLQNR